MGDPIGDALRDDAKAYWKLDETSGTRIDATGNGYDVPEVQPEFYGHVAGVAGKVGNCVKVVDDPSNVAYLFGDVFDPAIDITVDGFTFAAWVKINDWLESDVTDGQQMMICDMSDLFINVFMGNVQSSFPNFSTPHLVFQFQDVTFLDMEMPSNQWVFVVARYDYQGGTLNLKINNDNDTAISIEVDPVTSIPVFGFGSGNYVNNNDTIYIDEPGLWLRGLTSEQEDYLWNNNDGRALFPAPDEEEVIRTSMIGAGSQDLDFYIIEYPKKSKYKGLY